MIDLKGIAFDAGTSWDYYDNDGSDTGGMLTIYENIDGTDHCGRQHKVWERRLHNGKLPVNQRRQRWNSDRRSDDFRLGTVIDAGNGGNTLTGTAGSDTFVFKAITDSQPGAGNFDYDYRISRTTLITST